eukprot:1394353-Pyramimonas_sp.AAC.1
MQQTAWARKKQDASQRPEYAEGASRGESVDDRLQRPHEVAVQLIEHPRHWQHPHRHCHSRELCRKMRGVLFVMAGMARRPPTGGCCALSLGSAGQ